jgi:DNA-binding GntR family transcriptional regulator
LRDLILTAQLGISVQLKQQPLAERCGVSRIPMREALKRLAAEGLIEHKAHQGLRVAARSVQELGSNHGSEIGGIQHNDLV